MKVYLDHNATTPVDPKVFDAMLPYLGELFGNPSSIHRFGQDARRGLDLAREQVASLIGAHPEEIIFTSGGTESNNTAIIGSLTQSGMGGLHVITSRVEHPAVLDTCEYLESKGFSIFYCGVDSRGFVSPDDVESAFVDKTALVSVMLANNDVGTVQPVAKIAEQCQKRHIPSHTDAVQAVGKIPVNVDELGVDLLSFSSHKIYGPKGAGALYVRRGTSFNPLIHGGHQEFHRRGGTENLAAIAGFGKACELTAARLDSDSKRIGELTKFFVSKLNADFPEAIFNGPVEGVIPGTVNLSIPGIDGETLLMALDLEGIAVSLGSACTAGSTDPSHVLLAMGLSFELAKSSIRISIGRNNTMNELTHGLSVLKKLVARLKD